MCVCVYVCVCTIRRNTARNFLSISPIIITTWNLYVCSGSSDIAQVNHKHCTIFLEHFYSFSVRYPNYSTERRKERKKKRMWTDHECCPVWVVMKKVMVCASTECVWRMGFADWADNQIQIVSSTMIINDAQQLTRLYTFNVANWHSMTEPTLQWCCLMESDAVTAFT